MKRFRKLTDIPNPSRRGAVVVWFIVALPVLLTLLCVVLEVSNLYLARAELHNALESASQAAVKEWADQNGGDTLQPRLVGNAFAMANTINGVPVDLTTVDDDAFPLNYDPAEACNQNACSTGVFVFGAIVDDDPDFIFDCCETPRCGVGTVLFDASGQGQGGLNTGNNHEWGIRFLDEGPLTAGLLITEIRITLPLASGAVFEPSDFEFADLAGPFKVVDQSAATPDAPDLFGIDPANQIAVNFLSGNREIQFLFSSTVGDAGFEPGDRFRFGLDADRPGPAVDGDAIGDIGTQVFVQFNNGSTSTGVFVDTMNGGQFGPPPPQAACASTGIFDPVHQSLAVTPRPNLIPDLPCAPAAARNNDGQSFVQLQGGGGTFVNAFAVRAQATYPVPSICCELFGVPVGPFTVSSTADALYDCADQSPRLYHLKPQNFLCNVACP